MPLHPRRSFAQSSSFSMPAPPVTIYVGVEVTI